MKIQSEKTFNLVLYSILSIATLTLLFYSIFRRFDIDEFEAIHTAWKMLNGERIYIDFFQHHHPLLYYMLIPIIYVFGETLTTLIAARILIFIFMFLIGFVTYYLCKEVYDKKTALINSVLLYVTPIFFIYATEIRPDVPQVLFGTASVLFLVLFFKRSKYIFLTLSAFSLSFSFLSLQKAIFLIGFTLLIFLHAIFYKKIKFKDGFLYGLIFSLPILTYFSYHIINGSFQTYFFFNYIFNSAYGRILSISQLSVTFRYAYETSTIMWLFYTIGLLFYSKTYNQKILSFLSLGLIASLFFFPFPFQQYLLQSIPFVICISSHAIKTIFERRNKEIILLLILISTVQLSGHCIRRIFRTPNTKQWKRMQHVMGKTTNNDYVFWSEKLESNSDGTYFMWNLFRKDHDYFWLYSVTRFASTYEKITGKNYGYDVYKAIEKYKPKIITKSSLITCTKSNIHDILKNPIIYKNYKQDTKTEDLLFRVN